MRTPAATPETPATPRKKWTSTILLGIIAILVILILLLFMKGEPEKVSTDSMTPVYVEEVTTESDASITLEKDVRTVTSSSPELIIEKLEPEVTPTSSLSITQNIDKVKFIGDAGFSFLKSSTGAMLPVFWFKQNLLDKVGQTGKTPYLYKSSEGNIAPKFKKRGEYYYTIDAGKKIYPAPGKNTIITSNAYLGMKANGYEAWLAYELEENGYMDVGEKVSLLYDPATKGINFAIKVSGWAPR